MHRQDIEHVDVHSANGLEGDALQEEIEDSDGPSGNEDRDASSVTRSASEGEGIVGEDGMDHQQDSVQVDGPPADGVELKDNLYEEIDHPQDTEPFEVLPENTDPVSHIDVGDSSGIEQGKKRKFGPGVGDGSRGPLKQRRTVDGLDTVSRDAFDEQWWNQYVRFDDND